MKNKPQTIEEIAIEECVGQFGSEEVVQRRTSEADEITLTLYSPATMCHVGAF